MCRRARVKESQRVKPKYYYTCYNSLLFQWQRSWSEGDFITLQVITSYIKLGWPQFLSSRSVCLTVKLTALHHRVIRLACWLCIKQEQTQPVALLRLLDGDIRMRCPVVFCRGRHTLSVGSDPRYVTMRIDSKPCTGGRVIGDNLGPTVCFHLVKSLAKKKNKKNKLLLHVSHDLLIGHGRFLKA